MRTSRVTVERWRVMGERMVRVRVKGVRVKGGEYVGEGEGEGR